MLLLLAAQPLLSMHARIIFNCYLLLVLGLGYHLIIIVVDEMIIIINVDYIRRRMEGWAIPSDALFHSSHLGSDFRVLCLFMSMPNRVWDAMGSLSGGWIKPITRH